MMSRATERATEPGGAHHVPARTVLTLLGGRFGFRGALLLANAVLAGVWGSAEYAACAAALGASTVLISLAAVGLEKTALTLVPRAGERGPEVIRTVLTLAGALAVICAVVIGVRQVVPGGDALAAAAGVYSVLLGQNQLLVGLHRARGNVAADYRAYAATSVWVLAWCAAVVIGGAGPLAWLLGLCLGLAAADAVLAWPLLRSVRGHPGARLGHHVATAGWMAVGDLVPGITLSLIFIALSMTGRRQDSGALYLTITAATLVMAAFAYLLRILQPRVSLALAGEQAWDSLRPRARRWLARCSLGGSVWTVVVVALVVGPVTRMVSDQDAARFGPFLAFCLLVPIFVLVATVNYALENSGPRPLRLAATTSAAALLIAVAPSAVIIDRLGGVGAIAVLAIVEITHAALMYLALAERTATARDPSTASAGKDLP